MVRIFLGILMLFAIGGAVAGVITYMRVQDKPVAEGEAPKPTARTGRPSFVELDPINVPIQRDDEVPETRTYIFVLESKSDDKDTILRQRVRLRDTYTRYVVALSTRAGPENLDNVAYLKAQLQAAANEILGPGVVQGVLIKSVLSNITG